MVIGWDVGVQADSCMTDRTCAAFGLYFDRTATVYDLYFHASRLSQALSPPGRKKFSCVTCTSGLCERLGIFLSRWDLTVYRPF